MTGSRSAPPVVSIVIATHNRSQLLRRCLESLDRQSAEAADYEVVVAVDGGTDDTVEMAAGLTTRYALTVVEQTKGGSSTARNTGVTRASGKLLLFMDDDEEAEPTLVSAHLEAHRGHERLVGVGIIKRRVPETADRFARVHADNLNWWIAPRLERDPTYWDCYSGNCSVARAAFDEAGGFATDFAGDSETDTELAYRLDRIGYRFVFVPDAIVTEYRTRPWHAIFADIELRGRTAIQLYNRYPAMISSKRLSSGNPDWGGTRIVRLGSRVARALQIPTRALGAAGFLLPRRLAPPWFWFVYNHAYWRGVRAAASDELWRSLTSTR